MVNEKRREEEQALSVEYKAREVPKNVKQNKFEKLMREQEQRRADAKRFYGKDQGIWGTFCFLRERYQGSEREVRAGWAASKRSRACAIQSWQNSMENFGSSV